MNRIIVRIRICRIKELIEFRNSRIKILKILKFWESCFRQSDELKQKGNDKK